MDPYRRLGTVKCSETIKRERREVCHPACGRMQWKPRHWLDMKAVRGIFPRAAGFCGDCGRYVGMDEEGPYVVDLPRMYGWPEQPMASRATAIRLGLYHLREAHRERYHPTALSDRGARERAIEHNRAMAWMAYRIAANDWRPLWPEQREAALIALGHGIALLENEQRSAGLVADS